MNAPLTLWVLMVYLAFLLQTASFGLWFPQRVTHHTGHA
jgi:hypothetical protein